MKKLFIIAVFAMGIYDGWDVTAGVVLSMLFMPTLLEKRGDKNAE